LGLSFELNSERTNGPKQRPILGRSKNAVKRGKLDGQNSNRIRNRTHGISESDFYIIQVTSIKCYTKRECLFCLRVRDQVSWRNIAIALTDPAGQILTLRIAWYVNLPPTQFNRNASLQKRAFSRRTEKPRTMRGRRYASFGAASGTAEDSSVVGMAAALFLFALGLSGALLTFEDVIDPALNPSAWYVKPQGTPLKLTQITQTIRQRFRKARLKNWCCRRTRMTPVYGIHAHATVAAVRVRR